MIRFSPTDKSSASSRRVLRLTPWPKDILPEWDTLPEESKKLFAHQADVYGAYVAYTDHEIGRVIQAIEDMGKLDNTLIIYISGDTGTSAEGTLLGTPNQYTSYNGILEVPVAEQLKAYDAWGSEATYPHMSVAWSWAFDTPFKWTKQVASHFGVPGKGWRSRGPGISRTPAPSAPNFITLSTSCLRSSKLPPFSSH
ncbi:MAG: sulfatase-like hydrolase/transferase [Acidobacteriaceae bacterium]